MTDAPRSITIEECIEFAGQSPREPTDLARSTQKFQECVNWLEEELPDEEDRAGLQRNVAGHVARSFFAMLQTAQKTGVSPDQLRFALQVELSRHCHAIDSRKAEQP